MHRVLVVDDDDELREFLMTLLGESYETKGAPNGEVGLKMVHELKPDLVVLDLLMPRMHGFEFCQRLRADPDIKHTKVLISSSKSYTTDMRTAVEETGADGYIVKPFDIDEFKAQVAKIMGAA